MIKDEKYYISAVKRAKKCGIEDIDRYGIIIFLEKEIDDYRRKLDYAESRIQALCAQQMQSIQNEQKLNKERKELHKPATGEIIKALADSGYNSITITAYKDQEGKQ